jgi:hypothetical protein
MKTQVKFRSDIFPPYEGEEEQINPGLWGKRLAEYLLKELHARGIQTEEPIPEDWGWYIPLKSEGHKLGVCCGHQNGDDDEFICFTSPSTPVFKRWFRTVDVSFELERVTKALEDIFAKGTDFRSVKWE